MGVLSCKIMVTGMASTEDNKYTSTYVLNYLVVTDNPDMLPKQVRYGAELVGPDPLPQLWSIYDQSSFTGTGTGTGGEYDAYSFLQERATKRLVDEDGCKYQWMITCTWKPPEPGQDGTPLPANPLLRPVKYQLESSTFDRKITKDVVNERPIANSAGDLYEDIMKDDSRPVLVAVKNMADLNTIALLMVEYANAVNTDTFFGAPAYCAKIDSIVSGQIISENGTDYYAVTFRIQFTRVDEPFTKTLDNKGTMAYDRPKDEAGAIKSRVIVLDGAKKGEFKTEAYLDYDGTQLPDGDDPLPIPADDDPDGPFNIYYPLSFAALGIGGS